MEPQPAAALLPPSPPRPPAPPGTDDGASESGGERRDPWAEVNRAVVSALPEWPVRVLDIGGRLARVVLEARPQLQELVVLNPYPTKRSSLQRLGEDHRVEVIDAWPALDTIPTVPRFDLVLWRHWCPVGVREALLSDAVGQLVAGGTFIDHVPSPDPLVDALTRQAFGGGQRGERLADRAVELEVEMRWLHNAGLVDLHVVWSNVGSALVVCHAGSTEQRP